LHVSEWVPDLNLSVSLTAGDGVRVIDEDWQETGKPLPRWRGPQDFEAVLAIPPVLAPGEYVVGVWCASTFEEFLFQEVVRFRLTDDGARGSGSTERRRIVRCPSGLELRTL
jgi:hypothetical protein